MQVLRCLPTDGPGNPPQSPNEMFCISGGESAEGRPCGSIPVRVTVWAGGGDAREFISGLGTVTSQSLYTTIKKHLEELAVKLQ